MLNLRSSQGTWAVMLFCIAAVIPSSAQTFTALTNLNPTIGTNPWGSLVQRADGSFYGTANQGTFRKNGSVFKVTTAGTLALAHYFCSRTGCADGQNPQAGLVAGSNEDYYGTTDFGGANNFGTIFAITEGGTLVTLHTFNGTDGGDPRANLIEGADGNYYGITSGGTGSCEGISGGCGTVFKMSPSGTLTTLHMFTVTDGAYPVGGLVQGTDGNFYGTTTIGGDLNDCGNGCGTVFKITPSGTLTTLHMFNKADGFNPQGALVQASNGNFYGTTTYGGSVTNCDIGCGTIFEITPSGTLTTLYKFNGTDGGNPWTAALIQGTDGNLYGTTSGESVQVGAYLGTVFEITLAGTLTTLHDFLNGGGSFPVASLVQGTDGNFYGTTHGRGEACPGIGCGTVFKVSTDLGPFVITVPTSGKIGRKINILGTNLTGATGVTFNGTAAAFTVASATEIKTAVPAGATTGTVQVVTPSGTLSSNIPFRVP